ncbi:MAG TPA: YceI family protein [Thermoanaerobaculia bacterium]|nr:YceI family protein [Thermoanaerobaculia bacterium]
MKRFAIALALTLAAVTGFADPQTYVVDRPHSQATFTVRHMMSKVSGKFDDFSGAVALDRANPAASSVEFTIKTASIDTGIADRDKHLRSADFFDAEKNPEIRFKSTAIAPSKEKNVYNVTGDLTMRGVTKRVTLPVEFLGFQKDPWGNERAGFQLETKLNRKDYGINWNKALDNGGFLLADDVAISINLEALPKK